MRPYLPAYRSYLYREWRACERFGILPSGIERRWDENVPWFQAMLMAYNEIREIEESDMAFPRIGF